MTASRRVPMVALLGTCVLHAAVLGLALLASLRADSQRAVTPPVKPLELSITLLPKPAPPPPPEPPPPEAKPEPTPPPPAAMAPPRAARPTREVKPVAAPPPAAAEAGRVLTASDDVVDFGETIVTGKGASYAGGVSANEGTSKQAVYDARAQAGGVQGGKGTDPNADASRAPQLAGGFSWQCPFPPEADDDGIDHAVVSLRVEVAAYGGVLDVKSTADPGHGFAREARRCAQQKRWEPGRDRAGNPTRAIALVNVRFER